MAKQLQVQVTKPRTRAIIIADLNAARGHRDFAARTLTFDVYTALVEKIDDLLAELFSIRCEYEDGTRP